ncbi:MAG TPA: single-stranded-DNA-specific exonuclease RecJ [Candidatus Sulfopaludibacter sp.]|jgi:single-stranded-DNA-specific exonuclease|nr:single-stranded-DNA-specific exonuclease RecJ [Candidatus Sulfopaludibacter sp.]
MSAVPEARLSPARGSRWILPAEIIAPAVLARELGIAIAAAKVLAHRGLTDPAEARRFLNPSLDDLLDPFALRDMAPAVERIRRAIADKEKILIYGDYDVDGTTSVVLLSKAIELAGGSADYHVPHRLRDGYGMRPEVVETMAADGVKLIVSVDTGIRAAEVVKRARELGIDMIITDHHLPESELPPALAVLNPNRPDCTYPEKNLCGAGVAFKLVQALLGTLGWPDAKVRRVSESFLKLVAIATVADVVPLTGENRVIVRHGLNGLHEVRNPGLRAILDVAGFTGDSTPGAHQVAFQIAPRINAAGRMDTANAVVEMFLTNDPARARELAKLLHDQNGERQQVELQIRETCERIAVDESAAALVYYDETWHRGVLGIVASKLVDRLRRPVFVLGRNEDDGMVQGSGRSIPAFHLLEALESMPELFLRFGGHKHAAGVTMNAEHVEEFRRRFNEYALSVLKPEDFLRNIEIEAVVELRDITENAVVDIFGLAPFGHSNQPPWFAAMNVEVAAPPVIMKEKHLRVNVKQNGRAMKLKAWNMAERAAELVPGTHIDVAFQLEEDPSSAARGYAPWSATLRDFRIV